MRENANHTMGKLAAPFECDTAISIPILTKRPDQAFGAIVRYGILAKIKSVLSVEERWVAPSAALAVMALAKPASFHGLAAVFNQAYQIGSHMTSHTGLLVRVKRALERLFHPPIMRFSNAIGNKGGAN